MRDLTINEINSISGAGLDKDASVAVGSAAGGLLGKASRIPGADIAGGAMGGYIGGVIADSSNKTINIPSIGISSNPNAGLGGFNPNYNPGLLNSGFSPANAPFRNNR